MIRPRSMCRLSLVFAFALAAPSSTIRTGPPLGLQAGELGFLEDFALAKDRAKALEQLIPGTEDYYYYHALHHQNLGELDEVDRLLGPWIERHKRTARVQEIEARQALLRYPTARRGSLDYLRNSLGLRYPHERRVADRDRQLPSQLDPNAISRATLTNRALSTHSRTLRGFEDRAMEWVARLDLTADRRRELLSRLRRPDLGGLPELVVADLRTKNSRGFGSLGIHSALLLDQLDACLRLEGSLIGNENFIHAYLTKLRPGADDAWRDDADVREAYLDRLQAFVGRLPPAHNSLKANVLYHRLVHDRARGRMDKARFLDYLQLPRHVAYINREFMKRADRRRHAANLGSDYRRLTRLAPIGNDEPVVRSYLAHFLRDADSWTEYARFIDEQYLRHVYAETKILAGVGDQERWYSLLPPEMYQALKERVDIDFEPTNSELFGTGDQVALDVWVKNVDSLIVKVFEINAAAYYRAHGKELDTAIDLDGLVASRETTHRYDEPALRRVKRHFEFPTLAERGTFVIEFIGNGKSSRALVRKGKLRARVRTGVLGHEFTVLDDRDRELEEAAVWIQGREYAPNDDGRIVVPFSNQPGRRPVVLLHDDFATLDTFHHDSERYALFAGIHVEREALISRDRASVILRPALTVGDAPTTLSVLEDVKLVVRTTNQDGVATTKEFTELELAEDRETSVEIQVPARLARVDLTLSARVEVLSRGEKLDLSTQKSFTLNGVDATDTIEDLHLGRSNGRWVLDLLGKTGEIKPGLPVHVILKHREFRDPVTATLQTDARGRVELGDLAEIEWVSAKSASGRQHRWPLLSDVRSLPAAVHGRAGETLHVPYMGTAEQPLRSELSLLETHGGSFARDRFEHLGIEGGFVELRDLPAGDYVLTLERDEKVIHVRVARGEQRDGFVASARRRLELERSKPLQIVAVTADEDAVTVQLANANRFTRVHALATHFTPEYPVHFDLGTIPHAEPTMRELRRPRSLYVVGRDIGDEYRYVLERRYAKRFPGNMLERPTLLLNPWSPRSTETDRQTAAAGGAWDKKSEDASAAAPSSSSRSALESADGESTVGFANLDFLGAGTPVLVNLSPEDDGTLRIPRDELGPGSQIHIVAVDPVSTTYRWIDAPALESDFADLRLANGLDPEKHYAEQNEITFVDQGGHFEIEDITTSKFEVYDSLDRIYGLLRTLTENATLVEFAFILEWPTLSTEEKNEKYSEYASHELNFFLYEKDPEYFEAIVRPYIANKYHKTFLDRWLLEDDLGEFLEPWAFERLNTVERILLARRFADEPERIRQLLSDQLDLLPPDVDGLAHQFATAIRGGELETDEDRELLERAKGEALNKKRSENRALGRLQRQVGQNSAEAPSVTRGARDGRESSRRRLAAKEKAAAESLADDLAMDGDMDGALAENEEEAEAYFGVVSGRKNVRQYFRELETTREWVENNYYRVPIADQDASLVTVNAFWKDYAAYSGQGPFFSTHFSETARNFTEMMFCLSVLDVPFEAAKHESSIAKIKYTLDPKSPLVVFHKEIHPAEPAEGDASLLVSQNFYRQGERYKHVGGEQIDNYVSNEFLVHTVYGCHVVLTNPTSARQKVDVLLQIPEGALPVAGAQATRSLRVQLDPYRTWTHDFHFYFPATGDYGQFPVHVARSEQLVAFAAPARLRVVEEPSEVDTSSWDWISQHGSPDQVIEFLARRNLGRVSLDAIAWRMKEKPFFERTVSTLRTRHEYDHTLWSYAVLHDVPAEVQEFLRHSDAFVARLGGPIESALLTVDPVERKSYQHAEYWPLVNARAHRLGRERKILNDRFFAQYTRFLKTLTYRAEPDDATRASIAYYLTLQDRVEEAVDTFESVRPAELTAKTQYDYMAAYLGFYTENLRSARALAERYVSYPVDRWRKRFANVLAQIEEIDAGADAEGPGIVDDDDRTQKQTELASTEASIDFTVESGTIRLRHANLDRVTINYYLMDIELLFSRTPFLGEYSGQFAYVRPNFSTSVELDETSPTTEIALPEQYESSNLLVEVTGGGEQKAQTYFANSLALNVTENYAQIKVTDQETNRPLSKVYVKVFARSKGRLVRFYKDGYTDLRGRFDYGSISTKDLGQVDRLAVLVLSDTHGASVLEVRPPQL